MADKTEMSSPDAVRLCLATAQKLEQNNDENGALEQYECVVAKDPTNLVAVRRLAVLYDRHSPPDFTRAEANYRQAAQALPNDADLFNDWGYSCFLRNDWNEAEQKLRQALMIDPTHRRARCNLGLVLGHQGRTEEAFQAFRTAGVSEAESHCNLAFISWSQGQLNEARGRCRLAQQCNPNCTKAQQILAQLDRPARKAPEALARASAQKPARSAYLPVAQAPVRLPRAERTETAQVTARLGAPLFRAAEEDTAADEPVVYRSPSGIAWKAVTRAKASVSLSEKEDPPPDNVH
jgi:Flp pilus assembly protein TadD